jgi:predicted PhzF superfamily epimerase YddE/YHI9
MPPLFLVDAFTREPFAGNPAGVCLLKAWRPDGWLQAIAAEMNVAETAFLVRSGRRFHLRWFTPAVEVPLCGHATLASAHVLFETGRAPDPERVVFDTRSGELAAARSAGAVELDFPVVPVEECNPPDALAPALGRRPAYVGLTAFRPGRPDASYFCVFDREQDVRDIRPDLSTLRRLPASVIVTARAAAGRHAIVSRYFAPAVGIDEDPVTGSAHCALAAYWAPRLGRDRFLAWQASPRGGEIEVSLRGSRVGLCGHAVTVWSGRCRL